MNKLAVTPKPSLSSLAAVDSRPAPLFTAGYKGLDFVNSIGVPDKEIVEWLFNGDDLLSWLTQAKLLSDFDVKTIRAVMSPRELDSVAGEARKLRAWFRVFVIKYKGRPLTPKAYSEMEPLNRILGLDGVFWRLEPTSKAKPSNGKKKGAPTVFHLRPTRRWRNPESLLAPIAEEIAKFISVADFKYIKECEGESCTFLFVDETRDRRRRWCAMANCGNRAKQAAYQLRSAAKVTKKVRAASRK